jgi:hypothetical protein
MKTSTTITKIMPSLAKALSQIKGIKKDAQNPFLKNKYISLDSILECAKPIMASNDIAIIQTINNDGVETFLLHASGEWISSGALLITPQESKGLSLAQSMGVATTYAKRYQLGSIIGVNADEDTDGSYGDNSGLKTTASKPNISEKQFKEALSRASDPLLLENIFKTYMLTAEQKTQLNKEAGI